jgi:hypothetical protein
MLPDVPSMAVEQNSAQVAEAVRVYSESTDISVSEVEIPSPANMSVPSEYIVAGAAEYYPHVSQQQDSLVVDHRLSLDLETVPEIIAPLEEISVIDALQPDALFSEQLFFDDFAGSTEVASEEGLVVVPPSLMNMEYGGMVERSQALELPETYAPVEVAEPITWNNVLEKESAAVYDDVTEVLRSLVAVPEQATFDAITDMDASVSLVESIQEVESPPPIAAAVLEKLEEVTAEEKVTVASILKETVEKIVAVNELTAAEAGPGAIMMAQIELELSVVALLERLGIHDTDEVPQFIALLRSLDFQPSQPEEPLPVDLTHEGTHEALAPLVSSLSDVEAVVEQLIGKLVLFYAANHGLSMPKLVAA